MRLLYVHERFGSLGGAEANALITATEMKARGHTVGILHGPSTGKGDDNWRQTFDHRFPLPATASAAAVQDALANFKPDVVYVHKMPDLPVIEALVNSGLPLIRMVHDHDIYCMRSYKYNYFTRKICGRAAGLYCLVPCGAFAVRRAGPGFPIQFLSLREKKREIRLNHRFHRMVVVSDFMRDELLRNDFDPGKIEIHAPVPRAADPHLRSTFSDRNLIIYAGQIIRGKGVDILLAALARLKVQFECVILGDGNHRAHCQKLATRYGLDGRVFFKGFVPQEELKIYYRECSVVAVSSLWPEPIATIGLEVLRYALPVVAFDAGGIKAWLVDGHNGYLIPWMDTVKFSEALEKLLTNKALAREMGQRGLELVSAKYDFARYIEDLEEMFTRVADEVRGPGADRPPQSAPVPAAGAPAI